MSVKKKLGMGIAGAVLSVGLISGGTFAYFSDSVSQKSEFSSGTIELGVDGLAEIDLKNLQPGESETKTFKLSNNGTLDSKVNLTNTKYYVTRGDGHVNENLENKFADNIMVSLPKAYGNHKVSLAKLDDYQDQINKIIGGIDADDEGKEFEVEFEFKETDEPQNKLQGLNLDMKWEFEAKQTEGEEK